MGSGIYGGVGRLEHIRRGDARHGGGMPENNVFGHFKVSNVPKSGGSILNYMEELVKAGQTMGYKMEGCEYDIMKIIEAQGDDS
nr:hydroxycinnamoyl-CoA quinate/shikimate transferase [Tanacetum cinerariifolium]